MVLDNSALSVRYCCCFALVVSCLSWIGNAYCDAMTELGVHVRGFQSLCFMKHLVELCREKCFKMKTVTTQGNCTLHTKEGIVRDFQ